MTKKEKEALPWLEYESQRTGKTVEQIRQEMRDRSALADRSNSGFAALKRNDPKKFKEVTGRGGRNAKKKKDVVE